ncbi:MAG: c-type cytochrome [Acidobacteria bacterium]|nr:c-type cytochrome [Acidobacteriota bacterium]
MSKLRLLIICLFIFVVCAATVPRLHAQDPPPATGGRRGGNIRDFLGLGTPPDPAAAERGAPLYAASCAFCHGPKARGAEGPNLIRSEVVLHDESGDKIVPYLQKGNPEKGMPAFSRLTEAQAKDIAQFLHLQVEMAANRGTYKRLNIVTGDAKRGEAYFNGEGKCATCHSVTGDLAKIGSKFPPDVIQNRFLWPGGGGFGAPTRKRIATVTLPDGTTVKGTIKTLDDFNVSLFDEAGNYNSWSRQHNNIKVTVEDPLKAHRELLDKYTDETMHDLTAYLVTLK